MRGGAGDRPGLTLEQKLQRFLEQERRDAEIYGRLTDRQRLQPRWLPLKRQTENAAKVGLILLAAGAELPEALARALALPPATGSSIGSLGSCLEDVARRTPTGAPWTKDGAQ